jgi:dolichol-phosphate mannosyltransferase
MKICLIIPTLNEEKNIIKLFNNIKKTQIKLNILFVDDNSSDQTQKLIISLKNKYNNIDYLFRKKKLE